MNDYWRASSDLDSYILNLYPKLPTFGTVGGYYLGIYGWDATRGVDTQITSLPNSFMNGKSTVVTAAGGIDAVNSSTWSWGTIRSVNIFLENYSKCEDPYMDYERYLGEAHFFKAWFYFEKVRDYGDVPWYTNSLGMTSEGLWAERTPRTKVVDSILWHLDRAHEHLPLLKESGVAGSNRLSKEAALLFKSRVALYEGTWQKYHGQQGTPFSTDGADANKYLRAAVTSAETLIDGTEYTKGIYGGDNPEEDYNKMFSLEDQSTNPDILLWRKYDATLTSTHSFQVYVSGQTAGISVTMQQIQHHLDREGKPYDYVGLGKSVKGNAFLKRIEEECDPRLSQLVWTPGKTMWDNAANGLGVFTKPFLEQAGGRLNSTGFQYRKGNDPKEANAGPTYSTNCATANIVFRYAEALLKVQDNFRRLLSL